MFPPWFLFMLLLSHPLSRALNRQQQRLQSWRRYIALPAHATDQHYYFQEPLLSLFGIDLLTLPFDYHSRWIPKCQHPIRSISYAISVKQLPNMVANIAKEHRQLKGILNLSNTASIVKRPTPNTEQYASAGRPVGVFIARHRLFKRYITCTARRPSVDIL